ncbi:hypothetical protein T484DRAFT_1875079 [Baffinella frigidus]|nr:hypothetical protein T484DRAFT_1875079 [Cryptophyta sp. CCMP2293]
MLGLIALSGTAALTGTRVPADPKTGVFVKGAKNYDSDADEVPLSPRLKEGLIAGYDFPYACRADLGYGKVVLCTPTGRDSEGGVGDHSLSRQQPSSQEASRRPTLSTDTSHYPFVHFPAGGLKVANVGHGNPPSPTPLSPGEAQQASPPRPLPKMENVIQGGQGAVGIPGRYDNMYGMAPTAVVSVYRPETLRRDSRPPASLAPPSPALPRGSVAPSSGEPPGLPLEALDGKKGGGGGRMGGRMRGLHLNG